MRFAPHDDRQGTDSVQLQEALNGEDECKRFSGTAASPEMRRGQAGGHRCPRREEHVGELDAEELTRQSLNQVLLNILGTRSSTSSSFIFIHSTLYTHTHQDISHDSRYMRYNDHHTKQPKSNHGHKRYRVQGLATLPSKRNAMTRSRTFLFTSRYHGYRSNAKY